MDLKELVRGQDAAPALVTSGGRSWSHAAVREAARDGARVLSGLGAGPGRVVGVSAAEPAAFLQACLAAWEAGAAVLPLDARAGPRATDETLARAGATAVVTGLGEDLQPVVTPLAGARPVDARVGLILFTSGSTGRPRGVLLGRAGVLANLDAILGYLPLRDAPRTAVVLPLVYSYALVGQALATLRAGGTCLLLGDLAFPAQQLEAMAALGAQGLSSVPLSLRSLARTLADLAPRPAVALRYWASAGGPLDARIAAEVQRAFPGARAFNQYGLTEASPRVCALGDDDPAFGRGSVGRALPGLEVRALDEAGATLPPGEEGELAVRGPSVMLGYLDDEAATRRVLLPDGTLRTGDRGSVDAAGYVTVRGRADGVVKVAGERVGLDEVELALRAAAGLEDLAVAGLADEALGTRLVAAVVGEPGVGPRVQRLAREALPPHKRPSRVLEVAALPRTANGKLDRRALEAMVLKSLEA